MFLLNKRPQARCPPTCEMSVCGEYVYNVYVKKMTSKLSPLPPIKAPPLIKYRGSGGAMVMGTLPVPGRPTIWITVGQGPIALAEGAGGGGLDIFTLIYPFSSFSLSLGDGTI